MPHQLFVALTLAAFLLPAPTVFADEKKAASSDDEITIVGCVAKGVTGDCSVLTTEDGKTYSFSDPKAEHDKCSEATGKIAGANTCNQGTPFSVSKLQVIRLNCCEKKK